MQNYQIGQEVKMECIGTITEIGFFGGEIVYKIESNHVACLRVLESYITPLEEPTQVFCSCEKPKFCGSLDHPSCMVCGKLAEAKP